jgi:hypothetical protein
MKDRQRLMLQKIALLFDRQLSGSRHTGYLPRAMSAITASVARK